MKTIIIPPIKSKTDDASDKNNYRPITLITAASKLLELVLLNNIETCIESSRNQFGFKFKHATDMCIYSLKMSSSTIDSITVLYFHAFLMPLMLLIELINGQCLKDLSVGC